MLLTVGVVLWDGTRCKNCSIIWFSAKLKGCKGVVLAVGDCSVWNSSRNSLCCLWHGEYCRGVCRSEYCCGACDCDLTCSVSVQNCSVSF